jgi:hypothetical protein
LKANRRLAMGFLRPMTRRVFGVIGVFIKYGCIAHCTFEYVADIVVVRAQNSFSMTSGFN